MATDLDEHSLLLVGKREEALNDLVQLDANKPDIHHSLNNDKEEEQEPQVVVGNDIAVHDDDHLLQETNGDVDTDSDADADADDSYVIVDGADIMSEHPHPCATADEPLKGKEREKVEEESQPQPLPTSTEINPNSPIDHIIDEVVQIVEHQENNESAEEGSKCEIEEGGDQIETNATIDQKDSLGSSNVLLIEDIREPTIEGENIVQPLLHQESSCEENSLPQVKLDSGQLTSGDDKSDDQAILDCESESKEDPELDPQTEVTDSVEPQLHQPCDNENTSQLVVSQEAEENQNSAVAVIESPESEPHLKNEEIVEEERKLESSAEVCHDTQITTQSIETETWTDVGKDCETETLAGDIPMDKSSTHLETKNQNPGMVRCPSDDVQVEIAAANDTIDETEVITDSAIGQESNSFCPSSNIVTEPLNVNGHVESPKVPSFSVEMELKMDVENVSAEIGKGLLAGLVSCVDLEPEAVEVSVERNECAATVSVDDVKSEAQLGNGSSQVNQSFLDVPSHDFEGETVCMNGITESTNLPSDSVDDLQSESWVGYNSPPSKELSSTSTAESESVVSKGPAVNGERNSEGFNDVKSIENEGDQPLHEDNKGKTIYEGDDIEGFVSNGSPLHSPEDSSVGPLEGTKVEREVENKPFRFLFRVPRYSDDKLRNQIELAQKQVEGRTQNRDYIRSKIQSIRACYSKSRDKFEVARSEERAARDALNAKRREMDSIQSVINRMKNATSIEDIYDRVRSMEHRIEHETVPLKEEKQLIREIKQWKIHREQLSSSLVQKGELQPTPEERVKIEDRFKVLKQERDSCRKVVIRLEGITKAAWKINNDENDKQRELRVQFRAADDLRQDAYIHLQNLKRQLYEKNKYFQMYKEDARKAEDCASARDREAVHHLCFNQVETIFELWNKNDEFRKDYIRSNTFSTLRRLRTLDGRSLGPEEDSPVLYNAPEGRVGKSLTPSANNNDYPLLPASDQGKSAGKDVVTVVKLEPKNLKDSESVVNLEQKHPTATSKKFTKPVDLENGAVTVSGREEKQENDDENKKTKVKEELARKTEELRRKEEATKLREQRRLEEKAKAKEAEERKRRNAEKAQARAELKAQKEAELKEKEKEKKARKKERKKEKVEAVSGGSEEEAVSWSERTQSEIIQEAEIKEKPKTVVKWLQKPSILAKAKIVPLPLRNRGKKRMQQWMWVLLIVAVVVALFLVGNIGLSFKFDLSSFDL